MKKHKFNKEDKTKKRRKLGYIHSWDADVEDSDGNPIDKTPKVDPNYQIIEIPEYKNWFEEGAVTVPYD